MSDTGDVGRRRSAREKRTDSARWSNPDSLSAAWHARALAVAGFVPAGSRVLDLGCGDMALERALPPGCAYMPSDLVARDARTLICDLNAGSLPDAPEPPSVVTLLGVIEYVADPRALLAALRRYDATVLVTYNPADLNSALDREALGWMHALGSDAFEALCAEAGWSPDGRARLDANQVLFRLRPSARATAPLRRVAVLSYNNVGNFGDRLGTHLLANCLPGGTEVTWLHHRPWDAALVSRIAGETDLLVLGIGNSLFGQLLTPELLGLVEAVPQAVGIFGTQYRERIDPVVMDRLIGSLTRWYARYEEDALLYGSGRDSVLHLGDWLVTASPMTRWTDDRILRIGDEIKGELPLDRTIQRIQRYRAVVSTRLHPLLCALTSAEQVGYVEQREYPGAPAMVAGKFRSMLMDVFGRVYPENRLFPVERDRVAAYQRAVTTRVDDLRRDLGSMLA